MTIARHETPAGTTQHPAYEPPAVRVLGTVHELTQQICIMTKTLGKPDYFNFIPITTCSA